jgi:hypothetical protein
MPTSSVPAAKQGLRTYLRSWEGLRPDDDVVIRSAPVDPEDLAPNQITFGDVAAPRTRIGLAGWSETPTMTCWIQVTRPGDGDDAEDDARDQAAALLALVEAALAADPGASATIPAPAQAGIGTSDLTEFPVDLDGVAGRRAQYRFTVTWTSHLK